MSYDEYRALRRFPALDGLRAVAAVIVFAFHFGGPHWRWVTGWIGVHLFFVLSGFLITTLLLREEERYRRISLRAFYLRRSFRIMPVYFVVLAGTWALAHLRGGGEAVERALPYYLLFLNEMGATGPFIHSWTIGIEQKFYLVWPALAFVLVVGAFRRRLGVTLGLIALLVVAIPPDIAWLSWPIHYVAILLGCLVAIVLHNPRGFALARPLTHPVTATAVVLAFTAFHLAMAYWPAALGQEAQIGVYAAGAALLLPALLARHPVSWLLGSRPMVFVGERSYSLYLVQIMAATTVSALVPAIAQHGTRYLVVVVFVGLLAADLLYRWVELPMIEVGRRLAARQRRVDPGDVTPPRTVPAAPAEEARPAIPRPTGPSSAEPDRPSIPPSAGDTTVREERVTPASR
ncbi:acyltransferase family protein [Plantactinospora sp. GCM10030261]|uniref:acyltransferase family protein n=1 Tax=Plantactinospora sp. GCM10030261 TaxID=3273420 RepID=UPI003610E1DA